MSASAPWFALSVDWQESEMFDDSTMGVRLAWVCLLCHVKAQGRAGKARWRKTAFVRSYRLSNRAVDQMADLAQKCGAAEFDNETVTICNWDVYQSVASKKKRPKVGKSRDVPEKPATHHPPPTTTHQSPPPPTNQPPPTLGGEGDFCRHVRNLGVNVDPGPAVRAALARGVTQRELLAIANHFAGRPGAWEPGALFRRIEAAQPGEKPDEHWPPAKATHQQAQRSADRIAQQQRQRAEDEAAVKADRQRSAALEQRWGDHLDMLDAQGVAALIDESAGGDVKLAAMLKRQGATNSLVRDRLLKCLDSKAGAAK